jgi:hypothetical protein
VVNVLQGGFMELFMPSIGAVGLDAGTIGFFDDGNCPIAVTSVQDTARPAVRVALDHGVPPGKFAIAGDRVSFREAAQSSRPVSC